MRKYRNVPTVVDGVTFASKKEARRWGELRLMEKAGLIESITLQPRYPLKVNEALICTYVADFTYVRKDGWRVVEDVKGVKTPEFKLKAKLLKALYGIDVVLT